MSEKLTAANLVAGQLYRFTYAGRVFPNLYRYEGTSKPAFCQLHGEYMGEEYLFTKRRNSEVRPWSENYWFRLEGYDLEPAEYVPAAGRAAISREDGEQ
jgi:hypothetical protein